MRHYLRTLVVKQFCSIILAFIYLSNITGITIFHHYCMGELVSFSLFHANDKECGKCGMKKHTSASKNCCKDVLTVVKSDDSHKAAQFSHDIGNISFTPAIVSNYTCSNVAPRPITYALHSIHAPPLLQKQPLFIQHQNFRI
jgi:hypothetical protein